ncbi:MBL fold metallo-hydrolase [Cupriavidus pauculus]|uniref:MBL fold metallo-hydrolase n=1 Tax=Cupriavidus pauculus TaxID=82633 RepID=A0A2N5CAA7_9BURK|nr:MBL fold metallo-hydrolase [Cupriavidus pauculus]PLP99139.1 MBL fold metallo-hydrolase [Cupriavidus pauculus]
MRTIRKSLIPLLSAMAFGATFAAATLPSVAAAAAPQVQTQGPGFYRIMVGDVEVTALLDGTHAFPVDTVVEGMSGAEIRADLARDFLTPPVQGSINAFLINTGSQLLLVDAGAGDLYGPCCGHLIENLRAAGYQPEQVDQVLLTHMHKDHIGGVSAHGKPLFPNAVLRVSKAEADYWLTAANKAKAPAFLATFFDAAGAAAAPYQAAHRFAPFEADVELAPGITTMRTPGHTPGHVSYVVKSQGQTMIVWGDLVHVAALQLRKPDTTVKYDSDAASARRSRHSVFGQVVRDRTVVAAAHIAFPGLGHLRQQGGRFEWVPVNYEAEPGKPDSH